MQVLAWLENHGFELIQTVGIVGSLVLNRYTLRKDETARRISNLAAAKQDYLAIWQKVQEQPELARILDPNPNLDTVPITPGERILVKLLIIQLDSVHRAMSAGLFVPLETLEMDIAQFFSGPIPRAVWEEFKRLQDSKFVRFVESAIRGAHMTTR